MDDRPVMRTEGGGGVRSACCVNSASGVRVLMPGDFDWGWSGFRTDCGEGGAGRRSSIFFRNFFPDDGGGRGGAADAVCLQVGSHRFSRCYGDRVHALVGQ